MRNRLDNGADIYHRTPSQAKLPASHNLINNA
jgi:hypothetical protein